MLLFTNNCEVDYSAFRIVGAETIRSFDLSALCCPNHTLNIFNEQLLLTILQRRNIHYHVNLFRPQIKNCFRLVFFHGGGFVSVRKTDDSSQEDSCSLQLFSGQSNVVWLNC